MKGKLLLAGLLVLTIVLSGCIDQEPPFEGDPNQLYKELSQKGQSLPEGKFSYVAGQGKGMPILMGDVMYQGRREREIEVYSLGEKKKRSLTMSALGISAIINAFLIEDKLVVCSHSSGGGFTFPTTKDGSNCQTALEGIREMVVWRPFSELFDEVIDDADLSYNGTKQYGGRWCHDFLIEADAETLRQGIENLPNSVNLLYDSPWILKGASAKYDVCVDRELGFVSYFNLLFFKEGKEIANIDLTLRGYDPAGASEADFDIPLDFEVRKLDCKEDSVSFTLGAFKPIEGDVILKEGEFFFAENFETIGSSNIGSLGPWEEKKIKIAPSKQLSGDQANIAVCLGEDNCIIDYCMVGGKCRDTDGGKNFNEMGEITYFEKESGGYHVIDETDSCEENTLTEYYCEDDELTSVTYECPSECSWGACSEGPCYGYDSTEKCIEGKIEALGYDVTAVEIGESRWAGLSDDFTVEDYVLVAVKDPEYKLEGSIVQCGNNQEIINELSTIHYEIIYPKGPVAIVLRHNNCETMGFVVDGDVGYKDTVINGVGCSTPEINDFFREYC